MDENTTTQATEETTPEQADTSAETPKPEEKLYTQEDVDKVVKSRLARAAKGQPSKEELAEFHQWKAEKQTEAEKHAETTKQLEAAQARIAELENRDSAMKSGCKPEFSAFVVHTVSNMDGDFADNLEEFKKSNPQYFAGAEKPAANAVKLGTAPSMKGSTSGSSVNDTMNAMFKNFGH